jgi:hypothetical protein
MSCALRVNTATSSPPVPRWGRAAKRGWCSVAPSPFAARCCAMLGCLWRGRCAVWVCSCGVVLRTTPHPGLVRSWLRHHRLCCGGRFPASAPQPPGGQVKQKHARTRSCFHPRPVQPRIHAGSAAVCVLPCPLDRAAAGGGHTQAVGCAGVCSKRCGRGYAATALHLYQALTDTQQSGGGSRCMPTECSAVLAASRVRYAAARP